MNHVFGMSQHEWDNTVLGYLASESYKGIHSQSNVPINKEHVLATAKQEGYKEGHGIEESIDGLDNMLEVYITLEQNNYHRLNDALFHDGNPDKHVSVNDDMPF